MMADESSDADEDECGNSIVVDNGTGMIKAGNDTYDVPDYIFPTVVAKSKHVGFHTTCGLGYQTNLALEGTAGDIAIYQKKKYGESGIEVNLTRPIQRGIIVNWDEMEVIWKYAFQYCLRIEPDDYDNYDIFMTEPVFNPKTNKEKMIEIAFEKFNFIAYYSAIDSCLALYSTGKTTGIVLNSGYDKTDIVPIYEGNVLQQETKQLEIGGKHVTEYLHKILKENGHNLLGKQSYIYGYNYNYLEMKEMDVVREIKEKMCYISMNVEEEMKKTETTSTEYILPDGKIISLKNEIFQAVECLFEPYLVLKNSLIHPQFLQHKFRKILLDGYIRSIYNYDKSLQLNDDIFNLLSIFVSNGKDCGIHDLLHQSIRKCGDIGLINGVDIRKELYANIVLSGGNTMFDGIAERITNEMRRLAPNEMEINVVAPRERKYGVWMGGVILSSLSTFQERFVTREQYDDEGASVVHRLIT